MEVIKKILLSVLHKKNGRNKKNLTICFACETNGTKLSVCMLTIVNMSVLVLRTGLWPSSETCGCHVLNVVRPYSLRDIWRSKILSNCHIIPRWKLAFSRIFFLFSFMSRTKNHATYMLPINYLLVNKK